MTADMHDPVKVALADLTDAFLSRHGCFPLDIATEEQRKWRSAMERAYEIIGQPGTPARARARRRGRAMQDAMAGRVRVRKLEWGETSYGAPEAQSIVGTYRVMNAESGYKTVIGRDLLRFSSGLTNCPTKDEAKAAAQADYERRILSALEPAGAQEGAYDPERDLEPCLEARLFVTPESLDAFMEANPLPLDPTPAPDVPGLVERAKATATSAAEDGDFKQVTRTIVLLRDLAAALEALQAEVAAKDARIMGLERDRRNQALDALALADRATAAEAERDALKAEVERKDKLLKRTLHPLDVLETKGWLDKSGLREDIRAALAPAKAGG